MKKTLTANISGKVFNIEEDAYGIMSKYLESVTVKLVFNNDNPLTSNGNSKNIK